MDIKEQKIWSVYVHIFPNGKKYVGITSTKPTRRWGSFGAGYNNQPVHYAIKKYGWDNIEHIILEQCNSEQKAKELEQYYIARFNSNDYHNGYNRTLGGDTVSENRHQKQVYKYDIYGNYICKYNSMTQAADDNNTAISMVSRICSGIKKNVRDITFRDQFLGEKIKPVIQQVNNLEYKFIPVTKYDLNGMKIETYQNYMEAGKLNGYRNHLYEGILNCCLGKGNTSRGNIWRFGDSDVIDVSKVDFIKGMRKKPVYQYDMDGKFISKYDSLVQASKSLNINPDTISNCLRGKGKRAGYYMWHYEYKGEIIPPYDGKKYKRKEE